MTLDIIKILLSSKKLSAEFPNEVSLLEKRIENSEIKSFKISENSYPSEHFFDICSSRLDLIKKNQLTEPSGFKNTTRLLNQFIGTIRVGYIVSEKKEKFVLHFENDLRGIVAIYLSDNVAPVVLDPTDSVE